MAKTRLGLTAAEWSIIKAVWRDEPCTAPQVQSKIRKQTGWTYSTVRTLMERMVAKRLLKAEKAGHVTIYRSGISPAQAQRGELLYALKHAFDGALSPMVQCLLETGDLSASDLEEIEALIKAKKKGGK